MDNLVNSVGAPQSPSSVTKEQGSDARLDPTFAENMPIVRAQLSEQAARQDFRRQLGWGLRESARG
jgi:hypothetical protein